MWNNARTMRYRFFFSAAKLRKNCKRLQTFANSFSLPSELLQTEKLAGMLEKRYLCNRKSRI